VRDARIQLAPYLLLFLAGAAISLVAAGILSASQPGFLLLCAALLRVTLLARAPDLSDDVFRYLWDGRLATAGISPYMFAPEEPALARVAPALASRVAHRDARTVYPPVAQSAFRVFGSGGHLLAWKSFVAAADLSVVALLASSGGPGAGFAAALYTFHPLPVTETAGEGHVDCLGVALLLASLSYLARNRRALAGVAFSMSVLTKYISLAAAIPLVHRGRCKFLAASALFASILWFGACRPGASPAAGLAGYATRWDFNSPLYGAAVRVMDAFRLPEEAKAAFVAWKARWNDPEWTRGVFPYFYSAFFARVLLALLLAVALAAAARATRDLEAAVFASLAALLLLSPTLYPWYLLWILPFAAKRREPAFLFLSSCAPISYALLYPLPGVSRGLVLACEYVPFAALLAWTLGSARRRTSA
jgi:alpha-1,6-mannosyltransferase